MTKEAAQIVVPEAFQSALPLRGVTAIVDSINNYMTHFNPHSPCGE